ncbi:transposase [Streptomyces hygroscopicus]|nr:transposase [Streptomyces hygroscopicus]
MWSVREDRLFHPRRDTCCVFVKINGDLKCLWRAVDQDGNVLGILVQNRRDKAAARRFLRRLVKKTRAVPRVLVTDKPHSCGAAHREVMPSVEHRSHKGLNNRAENSHQPTRQHERAMKGFRSIGAAQRFLSAFSGIPSRLRPRRHLMTATEHRLETTVRPTIWDHTTETIGLPATNRPRGPPATRRTPTHHRTTTHPTT